MKQYIFVRIGFHTTQYDLNKKNRKNRQFSTGEFPYYIVRFKPHRSPQSLHTQKEFPYYIVRFKLCFAFRYTILFYCFHTTQYDLNPCKCRAYSYCYRKFPYYIVRFKQKILDEHISDLEGFHTTQYDLNIINIHK